MRRRGARAELRAKEGEGGAHRARRRIRQSPTPGPVPGTSRACSRRLVPPRALPAARARLRHLRKWMDARPVLSWVGVRAERAAGALPTRRWARPGGGDALAALGGVPRGRLELRPRSSPSPRRDGASTSRAPISRARRFRSEAAVAAESLAELGLRWLRFDLRDDVELGPQAITLLPLATRHSAPHKVAGELEVDAIDGPFSRRSTRAWQRGGVADGPPRPARAASASCNTPSAERRLRLAEVVRRRARRHFTRFPRSTGPRR